MNQCAYRDSCNFSQNYTGLPLAGFSIAHLAPLAMLWIKCFHVFNFRYLGSMMASSISDTIRQKALHGPPFESWKGSGEAHLLPLIPKSGFQHYLCDGASIMWILDTICAYGKQDQCIRHILLQDYPWYQTPWLCEKCTDPWDDKHPASHQHCKAT